MTRFVGLIGRGLTHSISPLFQQAAFDHMGLDIRYEVWEVEMGGLPALVEVIRDPSKLGANVTIPHKEAVLPLLDGVDADARRMGAVNTVVNTEGRLTGYNTDGSGFLRALQEAGVFDPREKRAVILGAGGVARAAAFSLVDAGVKSLVIINRTVGRGEALAADLKHSETGVKALSWGDSQVQQSVAECDLLVNCTSVGMKGSGTEGQSPLTAELVPRRALVYDLVYNPVETELLKKAGEAGARTLGGLPMLVYQGAAAFELWTGKAAPVDIMMKVAWGALLENA